MRLLPGIALALALVVAACSPAAPSTSAPTAPMDPSPSGGASAAGSPSLAAVGGFFAVSVADLEASTSWYEQTLGLEVVLQPPAANGVAVVVLGGDGLRVELIHHDNGVSLEDVSPSLDDRGLLHGIVKAGVIVDDLDAWVAQLRGRGVPIKFGPFPATAEQPANLIIEDNEGNLIQFIGR